LFLEVEKEIQNKKRKKLFCKVRKDTIPYGGISCGNISHGCCGLTTYVNPSWCQISGLSFQEALGMVGLMRMMMIKQQLLMVGNANHY
jgi:PAS domain-containing protein